jgi:regulator of RNase E activity RraA
MVLADDEGIIVVDPNRIQTLLESAVAIKTAESKLIERLNTGSTLSDGLNVLEHVDALTRSEPSSLKFLV